MRRRKQYEVRTYLGRDLHSRVVAEMLARNRNTISATVREILSEYFAMREELATALGVADEGGEGGTRISHRLLTETEGRLSRTMEVQERRLTVLLTRLTAMIEELDLDLMTHLPEVTEDLEAAAQASGHRRHLDWLERIDRGRRIAAAIPRVTLIGDSLVNDGVMVIL